MNWLVEIVARHLYKRSFSRFVEESYGESALKMLRGLNDRAEQAEARVKELERREMDRHDGVIFADCPGCKKAERGLANEKELRAVFKRDNPCAHPDNLYVGFEDGRLHCCECWAQESEAEVERLRAALELEAQKVRKAVVTIERMDCDCAGEGVGALGGCFRCIALDQLSTYGWDALSPKPCAEDCGCQLKPFYHKSTADCIPGQPPKPDEGKR